MKHPRWDVEVKVRDVSDNVSIAIMNVFLRLLRTCPYTMKSFSVRRKKRNAKR